MNTIATPQLRVVARDVKQKNNHMNYKELNLKAKEQIELNYEDSLDEILKVDPQRMSYFRTILWNLSKGRAKGCAECGGSITEANLAFYNYDVEKVRCYECQNKIGFEN